MVRVRNLSFKAGFLKAEPERMLDFDELNVVIGTPELLVQAARYDAEDTKS